MAGANPNKYYVHHFKKTVPTGTPEPIIEPGKVGVVALYVSALPGNGQNVYYGAPGIDGTNGPYLAAGGTVSFDGAFMQNYGAKPFLVTDQIMCLAPSGTQYLVGHFIAMFPPED